MACHCQDGADPDAGLTAAYQYHKARREEPCLASRLARALYQQDWRQAPRRRRVLLEALAGFDKYPTGRRTGAT